MSLKKQATTGLVWSFAQQFGGQIIAFIVSLVLARLLLPKEFGLIGMIAIFYSIGRGLMDAGLTQSLIRNKEIDEVDYSTVFYFNLVASIIIYIFIFFSAPWIAEFYDQEILTSIVRLYCITFIIDSFSAVQRTRFTKKMDFKTQTLIGVPSIIIGGIVGITMAFLGYGVWSLVWNQIVTTFVGSLQLWIYAKWTPGFVFSVEKFKNHFNFGYKLTLSSLLNKIFNNIYLIVIGKYFSAEQVGFYTRAVTMKQLPVTNISNALNKVTYPLFADIQDDDKRLKSIYSRIMKMVVFIIAPILIIAGVLAEPTFRFLFTEKWLPAVPYFQILCGIGILYPISAYNLNVLKVKGRSDLFLKLEIYKKTLVVLSIVIAIPFGIYGLLWSQVVISIISFVINSYYTGKFIDYTAWQQIKDISPILLLSALTGVFVVLCDYLVMNLADILRILIGGSFGVILFSGFSFLFKFSSMYEIKNIIFKR